MQLGLLGTWLPVQEQSGARVVGNWWLLGPRGSAQAGDQADGRVWVSAVGGGSARTHALRTQRDSCPHGSTFQTCNPALWGRAWSPGAVGTRPSSYHSGGAAVWENRADPHFCFG